MRLTFDNDIPAPVVDEVHAFDPVTLIRPVCMTRRHGHLRCICNGGHAGTRVGGGKRDSFKGRSKAKAEGMDARREKGEKDNRHPVRQGRQQEMNEVNYLDQQLCQLRSRK